jgi:hypothetical protein
MTLVVFDIPPSVPDLTKRMAQMIDENIETAAKLRGRAPRSDRDGAALDQNV